MSLAILVFEMSMLLLFSTLVPLIADISEKINEVMNEIVVCGSEAVIGLDIYVIEVSGLP